MSEFADELNRRLDDIRAEGLHRELRPVDSPQSSRIVMDGKTLLNFSSNDYLGLANHPALKQAAIHAIEKFGAGSGASRLICGSLAPHHELEAALASFKKTESALSFSSGYAAAVGAICAVVGKNDVIVLDKLVHASIVDAARLSGAKLRVFDHNDLNDLESILKWADQKRNSKQRTLVVTESVFSMDGDLAPLREIVELKEKHGAWLMLDEAHATGVLGPGGRGLAADLPLSSRIEIQMATLGKALGSAGGCICGPRALIDYLVNRARSFIFTTAPAPAAAAAARAAIQLLETPEGQSRREYLHSLIRQLHDGLAKKGISAPASASAITPLIIGDESEAVQTATALREHGIFVPAIRYPTVARGSARLRVTVTASHNSQDLAQLLEAVGTLLNRKS